MPKSATGRAVLFFLLHSLHILVKIKFNWRPFNRGWYRLDNFSIFTMILYLNWFVCTLSGSKFRSDCMPYEWTRKNFYEQMHRTNAMSYRWCICWTSVVEKNEIKRYETEEMIFDSKIAKRIFHFIVQQYVKSNRMVCSKLNKI